MLYPALHANSPVLNGCSQIYHTVNQVKPIENAVKSDAQWNLLWFVLPSPQSSAPWGALHTPWPWRRKSFVSLPQHVKDINQRVIDGSTTYAPYMPCKEVWGTQGNKSLHPKNHDPIHKTSAPAASPSTCSFLYVFARPRFQVHTHLSNLYSGIIQLPKIGKWKWQKLNHMAFVWNFDAIIETSGVEVLQAWNLWNFCNQQLTCGF